MSADTRVLSEAFDEVIGERRVLGAVFLTFEFDPVFFEQQVLPIFFDANLSHLPIVRSAQLQLAMRKLEGQIVVFYDAGALQTASASPRLDVRTVPIRWHPGFFHPKNVLLLVEDDGVGDDQGPRRSLIVASLSANLTQSGWWSNVESCHIEELTEGDFTCLREPLEKLIGFLERRAGLPSVTEALEPFRQLLRKTEQRSQKTQDGILFTQFFDSRNESLIEFLERCGPKDLRGCNLEVLAPFLDQEAGAGPLKRLIDRFAPEEVRLLLPFDRKGDVALVPGLFDAIEHLDGVYWGNLPRRVARPGDYPRFVHAKAYRFFNGSREYVFVGSPNLTRAAFDAKNFETGFLVQVRGRGRRDFWLERRGRAPRPSFAAKVDDRSSAADAASALQVRYRWDTGAGEVYWDDKAPSPPLKLFDMQGVPRLEIASLPPKQPTALAAEDSERLHSALRIGAFLRIEGEGARPLVVLVQQDGMTHAPLLALELSVSEILEFWARATDDQRSALLEERILERHPELANELVAAGHRKGHIATFFDRFAGYFQAFNALEQRVKAAKERSRPKDAVYAIFSKQYDSLRAILERVTSTDEKIDDIDRYVLLLTAEQSLGAMRSEWPALFEQHREDAKALNQLVARKADAKARLEVADPGIADFLSWFEPQFLARVKLKDDAAVPA